MEKLEIFLATTPEQGKKMRNALDVSSYASSPYNQFSSFTYSTEFRIPVPGQDMNANSVESIWQGLKVIDGQTDFSMFNRKPRKRKGNIQGHLYGDRILGIVDARKEIYIPSYEYYISNHTSNEVKVDLVKRAIKDKIYFYDVEDNTEINDPRPLAHSQLLADYFNNFLNNKLKIVDEEVNRRYKEKELEHESLAEPVVRVAELFRSSTDLDKQIIKLFLSQDFPSLNFYHRRFYSESLDYINSL